MRSHTFPLALLIVISIGISGFSVTPIHLIKAQEVYPREETLYVDIDEGRVLTPDLWNPFLWGCYRSQGLRQWVKEELFYLNWENGTIIPWLAEGYEISPDYKKITIYVRKGVKWSDGVPFTAKDIEFTFKMLKEHASVWLLWSMDVNATIADVRAINNYTVVFYLRKPDPHAFYRFFVARIGEAIPIVPKHIWEGKDPLKFKNYPPVFTGPYRLVKASETEFVYERRDDWWATEVFGVKPAPKYIIAVWYGPEEKRIMAMARHKLDAICDISVSGYLTLRGLNPYVVAWYKEAPYAYVPAGCARYLKLNRNKYPWNITEVRWALSLAIDRDEIIRIAYEGSTTKVPTLFETVKSLMPYLVTIEDLLKEYNTTEYNPEKAKEILEKLGFKKGSDGIWVTPKGTRLEATLITLSPFIEFQRIAMVLAAQLQRFGIDVSIKNLDWGPAVSAIVTGKYDMAVWFICGCVVDPYITLDTIRAGWPHPEFNETVSKLKALRPEDPEFKKLFRDAMAIWLKHLPDIPLVNSRKLIAFDTYYWTNWPTTDNPYIQPFCWLQNFLFVLLRIKPARQTLTILAEPAEGGSTTPEPGVYKYTTGESITITATPAEEFEFDYWELDGVRISEERTITITMEKSHTLVAHFRPLPKYTLTIVVYPSEGGTTSPPAGIHKIVAGKSITVTVSAAPGYRFKHWVLDGEVVSKETSYTITMDKDHVLEAHLEAVAPIAMYMWIGVAVVVVIIAIGILVYYRRRRKTY